MEIELKFHLLALLIRIVIQQWCPLLSIKGTTIVATQANMTVGPRTKASMKDIVYTRGFYASRVIGLSVFRIQICCASEFDLSCKENISEICSKENSSENALGPIRRAIPQHRYSYSLLFLSVAFDEKREQNGQE